MIETKDSQDAHISIL